MSQGQQTQRPLTQRRPTLLSSCARATTAAEARYRISAPEFTHRSCRVIALDRWSAAIVRDTAAKPWGGGHFLVFESALPDDALLRRAPGEGADRNAATALLSEELDGADTVVMVASAEGSAGAASLSGDAAAARGIMSAGLVVPGQAQEAPSSDGIVSALRPNAMVLVILRDATDLPEVLSALRV
jgi:hypothetical protein